jgi:hypothetical protein
LFVSRDLLKGFCGRKFVPNNSIEVICLEKEDNVTDVDNEVSLGNKPISDPRTDDSEKKCNLPRKLDVVSRQLTRSDGVELTPSCLKQSPIRAAINRTCICLFYLQLSLK